MHTHAPHFARVTSWRQLLTAALVFLFCLALPAMAGSLQVAPILIEFSQDQPSQTLWLTNSGDQPLRAQVRVEQWTQVDAQDVLTPTDVLLASPPIVEIAPGQRQLVRVVRAQPVAADRESAFRLIVDELPGGSSAPSSGLQFLLRYSIPAFVLPAGVVPQLERTGKQPLFDVTVLQGEWTAKGTSGTLTLRNSGTQRARISQLSWVSPEGKRIELTPGLLGYVLPGQQMRWTLSLPEAISANGTLHAKLNDDPELQPLSRVNTGR